MKDLKKHLQVSDQLDLLISRGVLVNDRTLAERWLSNANYYRISGYLYRYRTHSGSYQPGTSLEQIHALYDFDRKLTRILMFALEDIEETLKTRISYTLTSAFPSEPLIYLQPSVYRDPNEFLKFQSRFLKAVNDNKNLPFVSHHIQEYNGQLPMWVAVEIMTMGNLHAIYRNLKAPYQKALARVYGTGPTQLLSWIQNLTYTRNHLAHYMRVYDFNFGRTPAQCTRHHIYKVTTNRIFDQIYLMSFMYSDPEEWNSYVLPELKKLLAAYAASIDLAAIGFPQNWEDILTIL